MFPKTFSAVQIGPLELKNRLVMAPLTRQVAELDGTLKGSVAKFGDASKN
jgi:2,4-dienoyl-CoA reductase-like NADH-dependent reductase (Old Yellow Enzyme family)